MAGVTAFAGSIGSGATGLRLPAIAELVQLESRRAVLWLPVFLGVGVWVYFALPFEPPVWSAMLWLAPLGYLTTGQGRTLGVATLAISLIALAVTAGFGLAKHATLRAAAPVLGNPVSETVEGRVIGIDRSASGAPRVLLDRVIIYGLEPSETPERIRIALLDEERHSVPPQGARLRVYARVSPPSGPIEPGAFDFRLRAWFDRLGGVGYARVPVVRLQAGPPSGWSDRANLWLGRTRLAVADALRQAISGPEGAFAAAIVTGDRSSIKEADAEALRISNLAHLLAISGLHMGILTGLVFGIVRVLLATWPGLPRRCSGKKVAAIAALLAGLAYLALSGGTVATQRAFVMVAVALTAVLLDRPAISLRALALAAAIVLAVRPVSLLDVGFQMSFAATAALVAGWEVIRHYRSSDRGRSRGVVRTCLRVVALYAAAVLFTSLVAGLATAPYSAWHFNRTAPYGLLANLAAVPAMGMVIAPSAIMAGILAPIGLAGPALWVMGVGIGWVLDIAHFVAGLPGAIGAVPSAGPAVLALITIGGLWACLWRGWWRSLGLVPILAGLTLWTTAPPRPDLLVAADARLLGLQTPAGRALSHERAQSFAAENWLRRDADLTSQQNAVARTGIEKERGRARGSLPEGWRFELLTTKKPDTTLLATLCQSKVLLIVRHGGRLNGPCRYVGRHDLRRGGAFLATVEDGTLQVRFAEGNRDRPWSRPPRWR